MKITIRTIIPEEMKKVWNYYTEPKHIVNWNFASDDWSCQPLMNANGITGKVFYYMRDYFIGTKFRTRSGNSNDLSDTGNYNKPVLV